MRVIAGTARSLPLKAPRGMDTRPTTDRIKETLFNMLQSDIPGCVFVDLYSGSGAIGIEAISRGAKCAYFVENAKEALSCIEENLRFTKFSEKAAVIKQDVIAGLSSINISHVDILFMDPPYDNEEEKRVLQALRTKSYITPDTLIIVEASLHTELDYAKAMGYEIIKIKQYKTNQHIFLRKAD